MNLRKKSLILSSIGFITSLLICGYAFLVFYQTRKTEILDINFSGNSGISYDTPFESFVRFGVLAICFLLTCLIIKFTESSILKSVSILFLSIILLQSYAVLKEPISVIEYELYVGNPNLLINALLLFVCLGGLIIVPAFFTFIFQIFSIWRTKTSKDLLVF